MLIRSGQVQRVAFLPDHFHREGEVVEKRQAIILGQHLHIAAQVADGHAHAQTFEPGVKNRANVKRRGTHIGDIVELRPCVLQAKPHGKLVGQLLGKGHPNGKIPELNTAARAIRLQGRGLFHIRIGERAERDAHNPHRDAIGQTRRAHPRAHQPLVVGRHIPDAVDMHQPSGILENRVNIARRAHIGIGHACQARRRGQFQQREPTARNAVALVAFGPKMPICCHRLQIQGFTREGLCFLRHSTCRAEKKRDNCHPNQSFHSQLLVN